MRPGVSPAVVALLACAACEPAGVSVSPEVLPATGYATVQLDLSRTDHVPEDVTALVVGGLPAFDLRVDGDTLLATVQGGPPGSASIVATLDGDPVELGVLTYEGPVDPLFERLIAFGASLTQGTRDAVPTSSSQLGGPVMQLARAASAFFPLPLLADPLTPMSVDDITACQAPDTVSFILSGIGDAAARLTDPDSGALDLSRARVTPEVVPYNVAIGNARMPAQRLGPVDDPVAGMIGRITLEAEGDNLFAPLSQTPIERVLALQPTLLVSIDLYGNDIIRPVFEQGSVDAIVAPEDMAVELGLQLDLLAATDAQVVLATLPDVTLLPGLGTLSPADITALQGLVAAYNDHLLEEADARSWLHVADLATAVQAYDDGLSLGGQALSLGPLGGLLSLDGLHFTDTTNALVAQVLADTLEAELGVTVPPIDVEAVLAQDIRSPAALRQAGVDPACLP